MRNCPTCRSSLRAPFISCDYCSWTATGQRNSVQPGTEEGERSAQLVAEARRHYLDSGPIDNDLTEQQWYNVCKFWPFVAVHCKRARPNVGPDHPLDATAREGPLTRLLPIPKAPNRVENQGELIE